MSRVIHADNGRQPIVMGTKLSGTGNPTAPSIQHTRAANARSSGTANTPGLSGANITHQNINNNSYRTVPAPYSGVKPGAKWTHVGETH